MSPGYSVWGGFVSSKIWTHLLMYCCVVHVRVWGPPEGLYIGKAPVSRTHTPGLAARATEHFRCLYRPRFKDANKLQYRLLRRKLWSVRFFPLAVFPSISQTLAAEAWAISMEAPMGNARDAAAKERMPRSVRLDEDRRRGVGERGDYGRVFGVVLQPKKLWRTGPRASQFNFQVRWGWTFLFLLSAQLRYGKSMRIMVFKVLFICLIPVGWGFSWRIV